MLIYKNNVSFWSYISKINNTFVGNAEDLNIVMLVHNLLEYSYKYSMTSKSLWNYYRDEVNDDENENDNANNNRKNNNKTLTSQSFEYMTKWIRSTPNNNDTLNTEAAVPLQYLGNFWRFLNLPLINCEIELDLSWSKSIISEISIAPRTPANPDANLLFQEMAIIQTNGTTFQVNNAKIYVWFVTLSINDNIKFLKNIKQGFKRIISWNKYIPKITTQPKNNNLDHLIDSAFRNNNRLFVLWSKNGNNDSTRNSFDKYYMPLVDIRDFNALIDKKLYFDQPVKGNKKHMKSLSKFQEIMIIQREIY